MKAYDENIQNNQWSFFEKMDNCYLAPLHALQI